MTHPTSFGPAISELAPLSDYFLALPKWLPPVSLTRSLPDRKRVHSPIPQIKDLELNLVGPH